MGNLILSRKIGESIEMETPSGETIILTIANICGSQARIIFTADENIIINRKEIADKIRREKLMDLQKSLGIDFYIDRHHQMENGGNHE